MPNRFRPLLFSLGAATLFLGHGTLLAADPLAELKAFSTVKEVNLEKLAGGSITAVRGTAMSSPRDMAVESCYVVRKPLAKTAELHVQWSPVKHPELKVYLHGEITGAPNAGQFQHVAAAPANSAVKWLNATTEKLAGSGGTSEELQMSAAEAKAFKPGSGGGGKGGLSAATAEFWANLLQRRAESYLGGGLGKLAPYEFKGETIKTSEEMARLLKQAAKIRTQFAGLIEATPLGGGKGSPSAYWEMFDAEGEAAFNLGALYTKAAPGTWQAVDAQYYSSGAYCAMLTFYQMWPVTVGGQECTLVWRGDLISSRALATLHGVERMGSSTALMRETQKSIKSLLDDAAKAQ